MVEIRIYHRQSGQLEDRLNGNGYGYTVAEAKQAVAGIDNRFVAVFPEAPIPIEL